MSKPESHSFGGKWTEQKLEILRKYLHAYTQALKNKGFKLLYIDPFAGTGKREISTKNNGTQVSFLEPDTQSFLSGSTKISLCLERPFDKYLFIEQDPKKYDSLCAMIDDEHRHLKNKVDCRNDDCNLVLKEFCKNFSWKSWRAVLFLDPFGMEVKWETMQIVAETKAIDVWVLFPLGVAVNRLLMKDGNKIPDAWKKRLDDIFGTDAWFQHFYTHEVYKDLFSQRQENLQKTGNLKAIAEFYQERLKTIFPAVAKKPQIMYNSRNSPIFMLCFAMGNPSRQAQGLALKLANDILRKA